MKKLIWLMVLGLIFFIGGQWWGLSLSEANRAQKKSDVQDGGASVVKPSSEASPPSSGTQETRGDGSGTNL